MEPGVEPVSVRRLLSEAVQRLLPDGTARRIRAAVYRAAGAEIGPRSLVYVG